MMFVKYFDQIESLAAKKRIDLADACMAEGVARTTLWRWRTGKAFPREDVAMAVYSRIETMAAERKIRRAA